MKAILVSKHGGPGVLQLVEIPDPSPTGDQVRVQHEAIGVNFVDTQHRAGKPYPVALPLIPGTEAAGVVTAVGPEVTEFQPGDRVGFAGYMSGVYADASLVPQSRLIALPDDVTFDQAAASLLQGMTAHALTESVYPVQAGDVVLIHAAAGGVGLYLVQMAKRRGATVIGTVSSVDKAQVIEHAGADYSVLYTATDFETEIQRITDGQGVHVVYDSVGRTTFDKSLMVLRAKGHMILYGLTSGPVPPFDINRLSGITGGGGAGSLSVAWPTLNDYTARREDLVWRASDVLGRVAQGAIIPQIASTLALTAAADAHMLLEQRRVAGKVLLHP